MQPANRWLSITAGVVWCLLRTSSVMAGEVRVAMGSYGTGTTLVLPVASAKEVKERGVILQRLDYSCGSAALATLFTSYLNQPYSESEIIDFIVRTGNMQKIIVRRGFSLLDLKRFAEAHGISATGYALDYDSLLDFKCPVLLPLYQAETKMRHFVIFRGATEDRVFLADPALGRRTMMRSEFERMWNPRVGMVFTHPGVPPAAHTPLALGPADDVYLSSACLRAVVDQTISDAIHEAKEFK